MRPRVVAVGLGPADADLTTPVALAALAEAPRSFVRTIRHPAAEPVVARGAVTFDDEYERADRFEEVYAAIVERLVAAAEAEGSVAYAVPGSPLVAESAVELLRADPRVELVVIPGMSFLDLAWARLGVDPVKVRARLVDAERFGEDAAGDVGPLLVSQAWSRALLSDVKVAPEEAPEEVTILHHLGLPDEVVVTVPWVDLDRTLEPDHLTSLWIPSLAAPVASELVRAAEVVRLLRSACPWDAEQTHGSLARHLLEETYEALEAIDGLGDGSDPDAVELLEEELGDVLCQVLFHSTIAAEEGLFNLADVAAGLADKLVRRHPHVFAGARAEDVLGRWELQKAQEKGRESLLDGIPAALPSLALAAKYERRAATVGRGIFTDAERLDLAAAVGALERGEVAEIGDLLFALARLAAADGADPEDATRQAANAFRERFAAAEAGVGPDGDDGPRG